MRQRYAYNIAVLTTAAGMWAFLLLLRFGRDILGEGFREPLYGGLVYLYALPHMAGVLVSESSYGPDKFTFIFTLGVQSFCLAAIGIFLLVKLRALVGSPR